MDIRNLYEKKFDFIYIKFDLPEQLLKTKNRFPYLLCQHFFKMKISKISMKFLNF